MKKTRFTRLTVLLLAGLMAAAALLGACSKQEGEAEAPLPPSNPLTGALVEDGFDETALDRRVMAFVVENAPAARPQWGMDDEEYSPDILLQGEVEGGITRTLWMYADYKKLPDIIGPTRSARPPFIRFSELFDAVFIHWGMSYSKGDYVGANKIFQWHDVDHINQMTLDDKEGLYDRDQTRNVSSEHTGIIHTDKLEATLKNEGIRSEPREFSKLAFYETAQPVSEDPAKEISVTYSEQADWETTDWTYNEEDEMYHTSSFDNDFKRDNLLILYDDTEYITKEDYHGSGSSVTYCDYLFKGGKAQLFTKGSVKNLEWKRSGGKLMLIDPDVTIDDVKAAEEAGEELDVVLQDIPLKDEEIEEAMKKAEEAGEEYVPEQYVVQRLNKGKTWIGWISSNNGGSVKIEAGDLVITMPSDEAVADSDVDTTDGDDAPDGDSAASEDDAA